MATICKRGDFQFQATIRRKGYPCQIKTFETRQEAEAWARAIESKMDSNQFRDTREVQSTTLGQALQRYLEEVTPTKRGHVNETNRIKLLQRHPISLRTLASLKARDYAEYRNQRLTQVGNNTVRLELAVLSHLYTIAIKEWSLPLDHEPKNIRKPPAGQGRDRRLVGNEEARLFAAMEHPQCRSALWLRASIKLAIETGMRAGEILGIEWHQVDLERGVIRLHKTKNGSARVVPLSIKAVQVLQSLPRQTERVIPNFHDTSGLDRAFKRVSAAAKISGLHFHDLRHECATRLAPNMKVQTLAKIMGWKTLQMAMRYYNPSDDELVRTIRGAQPSSL